MESNNVYQPIEENLKKIREIIKETYKKLGNAKAQNEKEEILKQFKDMYSLLFKIHENSSALDKVFVWKDFIKKTEDESFDELDKTYFNELESNLNKMQLLKKGLDEYSKQI